MKNLEITHYLTATRGRTGNVRLTATENCGGYKPQKFNAGGYGYDKLGTVLGQYLMANFAEEVKALIESIPDSEKQKFSVGALRLHYKASTNEWKPMIDGATGDNEVARTMKAIGLGIARTSVGTDTSDTFIVYRAEPRFLLGYITNLNHLFDKYAI
jgi:hypothetical protein